MLKTAPRFVRLAAYVLLASLGLHILYGPGSVDFGLPDVLFEDVIYHGLLIGSALICGARAFLVREERLPWALIAIALVTWSASDLYYSAVLANLAAPPFPSVSDAGWLFFYPAFWVAVILLMRRRVREFHTSLWLDGIVGALAMAACVAALVLPPILAMSVQGDTSAVAVNLAYPSGTSCSSR
jgi:diguanylate cyclase